MRRHFDFSHVTQELSIVLLLFAFVAAASLAPMCEQLWNTKSTGKDQQNVGISLWLWAASKKKKQKITNISKVLDERLGRPKLKIR